MFERFYVVFHSYRRWYALRMLTAILLCVCFIVWCTRNLTLAPAFYFVLLTLIVFPYSFRLGIRVKSQFDPFRSRLIPGWSATHLLVSAGQIVLIATPLAVIAFVAGLSTGSGSGWSVVGIVGLLWFEALLFFSIGYLFPAAILLVLVIVFPVLGYGRDQLHQLISILTDGSRRIAPLLLIVLDAAGTTALLRRMLFAHEEMPEFQWSTFNLRDVQRRQWASESPVSGFRKRLAEWASRSLDAIPRQLSGDLRSQIRHFQLGLTAPQGFLLMSALLIPTFWIFGGVTGHRVSDDNFVFWTWFPVWSTFIHLLTSQKPSFQWVFMLPLRRKEIVIRYLGAMFCSTLQGSMSVFLAVFVLRWMPSPGVVNEVPSLIPILESFSALLPIFGIGSLIVLWPRGEKAKRAVAVLAVSAVLTIVLAAVIARTTGMHDPAPVLAIATFITGIGLTWYSYRSWLQADLR